MGNPCCNYHPIAILILIVMCLKLILPTYNAWRLFYLHWTFHWHLLITLRISNHLCLCDYSLNTKMKPTLCFSPPILWLKFYNYDYYFLLKKRIKKQKQTPLQPCTPISVHFNMKSLKTPNSLITPQYPRCNPWKLRLLHMVVLIGFIDKKETKTKAD